METTMDIDAQRIDLMRDVLNWDSDMIGKVRDYVRTIQNTSKEPPYSNLSKQEIMSMLHEAHEDVREGRVFTAEEARKELGV